MREKWTKASTLWYSRSKFCLCAAFVCIAIALESVVFNEGIIFSSSWMWIISGVTGVVLYLSALVCYDISSFNPASSHSLRTLFYHYLMTRTGIVLGRHMFRRFESHYGDVENIQNDFLMRVLKRNADTIYGKEFNFKRIRSYEDYKTLHPVVKYDHYIKYVEKIANGGENVLTKSKPVFLASTSGTTGKAKLIPLGKDSEKRGVHAFGFAMAHPHIKGLQRDLCKVLRLWYFPKVKETPGGLQVAGILHYYMKRGRNSMVMLPSSPNIFDVPQEDAAFYCNAVFGLREREIGSINIVFSSQLLDFFAYMMQHADSICEDIASGCLSDDVEIPHKVRTVLNKELLADPERAKEVLAEIERGPVGLAKRLWPLLTLCETTVTGSMQVYADHLRNTFMKDVPMLTVFCGGTEGVHGINTSTDLNDHNYTLTYDVHFYEFIHEQDCDKEHPTTKLAHELTVGESYEIVLTSSSGLYRYRVGDVVKIVRYEKQCPVYEFKYRLGHILNVFWERTPESLLQCSVLATAKQLDVTVIDFTATEDVHFYGLSDIEKTSRRYILFIEIEGDKILTKEERDRFDSNLCKESEIYHSLRDEKSIDTMLVIQLRSSAFRKCSQEMKKQGLVCQFKMPRVMRSKQHLDLLRKYAI